jgi:CHAT domain-containing protein/Tfp pilus assembly protein PilF
MRLPAIVLLAALACPPANAQQAAPPAPVKRSEATAKTGTAQPADPRVVEFTTKLAQLHELWKARKYQDAIPLAEQVAGLARQIYGERHLSYTGSMFNLGMLYSNTRQYEAAFAVFAKVFVIQHELRSPTDKAYKRALQQVSDASQRVGGGREVVGYYEMALEKLAREGAMGTTHEVDIKGPFGRLLRFLADFDRAEEVLREALAVRRGLAKPGDTSIVGDLNNLAGLVRARGKYAEAADLYKEAIDVQIRVKGEDSANTGILLDNIAVMYLTMGQPEEAEPYQKRALAILEKALGHNHRSTGIALANMAELYRNLSRFSESEPLFERAITVLTRALPPNHPLLGAVTDNYAGLFQQRGQYQKALETYRKAITILSAAHGPEHPEVAVAYNNVGLALGSLERHEEAEQSFLKALAIGRRTFGDNSIKIATTYANLADVRIPMKKLEAARGDAERAIELISTTLGPGHRRLVFPLSRLGEVELRLGNTALAYEKFKTASEIYEATRLRNAPLGGRFDDNGALDRVIATAFNLKRDGGPLGAEEYQSQAFRFSQLKTATSAGEALNKLGARLGAGDPALRDLAREQQDITEAWAKADTTLIAAVSTPPARRDKAREAALRERIAGYARRLEAVNARLENDYPEFSELSRPRPLTIEALQRLLAPDEVLIQYVVNPFAVYAWAITPEAAHWVRMPVTRRELRELVHALRCGLDVAEWIGEQKPLACFNLTGRFAEDGSLPFATDKAFELYRKLLEPLRDVIADRKLLIVPSDALNRLPMHVLLTEPVGDDSLESLKDAPWLVRRHAITVLPSVSSLAILRRPGAATSEAGTGPGERHPYFALANPLLVGPEGNDRSAFAVAGCRQDIRPRSQVVASIVKGPDSFFRGGMADVARLRTLAPLPDTAAEVCAVARDLGVTGDHVLLSDAATETRLRALNGQAGALRRYRVLHFATHGLVSGELKGLTEPALVLTPPEEASPTDDGLLTASEVAELKLDADLVILSACNTAAGAGPRYGGDEALSGLARSFFFAGARSLLVSHWPVRSDATVELTTRALGLLARDTSVGRSEALRRAMVSLIDDDTIYAGAHPQVWAPFVVVGEGAVGGAR